MTVRMDLSTTLLQETVSPNVILLFNTRISQFCLDQTQYQNLLVLLLVLLDLLLISKIDVQVVELQTAQHVHLTQQLSNQFVPNAHLVCSYLTTHVLAPAQ